MLEVVRAGVARRGYPPSIREIGDAVGLRSTSSVAYHLKALQEKGYLHRDRGRPRTVELLPPDPFAPDAPAADERPARRQPEPAVPAFDIPSQSRPTCPGVGHIAAGGPILAKQVIEDTFPLPKQLVGEGEHLILQVRGDSMIDAAITDGDWVVVRRQQDADNGDIVAATFEGQGTGRGRGHGQDVQAGRRPRAGSSRTIRATRPFLVMTRRSSAKSSRPAPYLTARYSASEPSRPWPSGPRRMAGG